MSDYTPPPPPGDVPPPPGMPPGPGAPPPGPSGAPLDAGAAISYGWNGFTRNAGALILIAVVVVVVYVGLSVVGQLFLDSWLIMLTWNILTTVVSLILAMGLIRAALAVVDGRTPEVGMLFQTEGFVPYLVASILVGLAVGVGFLLCIIPGLILAFLFAFYGYAIVDGRTDDGIEAMKMSWQLVSANVGSLLLLFLLVLLINLLAVCSFGLLFVVTYPITAIAVAYAWRRLSGGSVVEMA